MAVGELFLAAFLQVLFDRLASRELLNFARHEGLEKKLERLKKTLLTIEAVLADAEEKQLTDRAVKIWLDDLRDLAYDAEDILDEFATYASMRKLKAERQASTSKLRNLVPACVGNVGPSAVKFNVSMRSKIKDITSRLEEISNRRTQLGLEKIVGGTCRSAAAWQRPPSTCLPTEPVVCGREEDKKKIIDLLLTDEPSDVNFRVVPIVGMGGLGKTTLARYVYNDKAVEEFHPKSWVCVSDEFDVMRLTKEILENVTSEPCNLSSLNQVQVKLRDALAGKKFLLVLDDVWNKDYGLWEALKPPFMAGAPGSRIIVTTRDKDVASMMGPVKHHQLELLSDDDCWSVFVKHAFENRDIGARPNLESIRKKIVEKCNGLPLAARTLGGLLRSDDDQWEDILNSKIWNLSDNECNILPVLRLSYYHLPAHLKRCFAYCAIFPKDFVFEEKEMVRLWMAEGFVRLEGRKQMEELGGEYFRELLSRSIFQASNSGGSLVVMHDLIHDLAKWVARETCFQLEDDLGADTGSERSKRARHSSYIRGMYDSIKKFTAFHEVKCLRTFLPLPIYENYSILYEIPLYVTDYALDNLLPKLKKLRVLSFSGYDIMELPDSIGDSKHLRYLNLSCTKIRSLPESTNSLYNLQSLLLRDCRCLRNLPSKMGNLINLLHLDITNVYWLTEMPIGMEELKLLRTLPNFVLGKNNGSRVKELMNFKFLRGKLCISNLENVTNAGDAREANLNEKHDLDVVVLEWSSEFDNSRSEEIERDVLKMLRPHPNLKELTIKCFAGNEFPSWLGDPSFSNIELLQLDNCRKCPCLPPLGQLSSLKVLVIKGMMGVKSVGLEFYGNNLPKSFPSLETLRFEDMQEWEDWNASQVDEQLERFLCLRELSIIKCPKLSGKLPDHLPLLEKLVIHECEQLVVSISSLPKLCRLEIDGCEEVVHRSTVDLSSLNFMALSKISKLTCLTEGFMRGLTEVRNLEIDGGCEELTWRWLPCPLESLKLWGCERPEALYSLTSLRDLDIYKCPSLISVSKTSLLSTLHWLSIRDCSNFQTLVDDEGEDINLGSTSTSLVESLYIRSCPSLRCLSSRGMLPTSLKHLDIGNCPELESIAQSFHNNTSLERISISDCRNLKSLPDGLHNLRHLYDIQILSCPSVISFPEGGLPTTDLRFLWISNCQKLEALPNGMHNLTSLQQLWIHNCPGIVSFPEEGFPTNLTSLDITNLKICKQLFEWGLHRLTSLIELDIHGGFQEEEIGMLLPISLTKLRIENFPNLKCLSSNGFQNLTSLEEMWIGNFPNLKYLSSNGFQNLTSLEKLWIDDCPKLTSFPREGLPPSLMLLSISNCPMLKLPRWSKIAHIPYIDIDGDFFFDQRRKRNMKREKLLPILILKLRLHQAEFISRRNLSVTKSLLTCWYLAFM